MKRAIGWTITQTYCCECAPEGLREFYPPLREGDDHGVPYICDVCDKKLQADPEDNE
jgi:hypothetical protein